jgi:hypothetical protein
MSLRKAREPMPSGVPPHADRAVESSKRSAAKLPSTREVGAMVEAEQPAKREIEKKIALRITQPPV